MKGKYYSFILILIVFLVLVFAGGIGYSILNNVFIDAGVSIDVLLNRLSLLLSAIIIIVFVLISNRELYKTLLNRSLFLHKKLFFKCAATILILIIGFTSLAYITKVLQFEAWGWKLFTVKEILNQILIVWLIGNILGAIAEEVIFRGLILQSIYEDSKNYFLAIIVSSFLFSLGHIHYQDFLNYVITLAVGILCGYIYYLFKSIYYPILIHFSYNLWNYLLASNPGNGEQQPYFVKLDFIRIGDGVGAWIDIYIIFSVFILILYISWINNKKETLVNSVF